MASANQLLPSEDRIRGLHGLVAILRGDPPSVVAHVSRIGTRGNDEAPFSCCRIHELAAKGDEFTPEVRQGVAGDGGMLNLRLM